MEIYYISGLVGNKIEARIVDRCSSEDMAKRLFKAMTGADVLVCAIASREHLVMHIRDLEVEVERARFEGISDTITAFTPQFPRKKK